jgi:hypothetical protein
MLTEQTASSMSNKTFIFFIVLVVSAAKVRNILYIISWRKQIFHLSLITYHFFFVSLHGKNKVILSQRIKDE